MSHAAHPAHSSGHMDQKHHTKDKKIRHGPCIHRKSAAQRNLEISSTGFIPRSLSAGSMRLRKKTMKTHASARSSAIVRTWVDEDEKKVVVQIEDRAGETLAYICLSPEKASDLSDCIAVYVAQMRKNGKSAGKEPRVLTGKSPLLC
jgi:hypothetical protein